MRAFLVKLTLFVLVCSSVLVGFNGLSLANSPFPDMPSYGVAEIDRLHKERILQGSPDGTLLPNQNVTRAEAVTMIGRALDWENVKQDTPFPDVSADHYASGYIKKAVQEGVVTGRADGTFDHRSPITREEMATVLSRAFNLTQTRSDIFYVDVLPSNFHSDHINAITNARISNGLAVGYFGPKQFTTRVDYSLFLARALYSEYKVESFKAPSDQMVEGGIKTTVINAPEGLNVRATPNTSQAPLGKLSNGTEVTYYNKTGIWAVIIYNGKMAYISDHYLGEIAVGSSGPLAGKTIVVDAGHGGHDPGAVSNGVREKDVVLGVSLRLRKYLEAEGAKVIMTRDSDHFVELVERANIANRANADSFISVHANAAAGSAAHGTETFWNQRDPSNTESKKLAEYIQRELIVSLRTRDRGVKEANHSVTRNSKMASVLVEVGFLTNAEEARKLASSSFQDEAAKAIAKGVVRYHIH